MESERAGAVGRPVHSLVDPISTAVASVVVAGCWAWLLWQGLLSASALVTDVAACRAPTGDIVIQVLFAIAVVIGTALFSGANAFLLVRFPEAWWIRIAPVLLFLVLVVGLLGTGWLTVVSGAMRISEGPGSPGPRDLHGDLAGAILLGWLMAPILISLVALVFPGIVGSRIPRPGRMALLSAAVPLALYGVGLLATVVLQAVRCPA